MRHGVEVRRQPSSVAAQLNGTQTTHRQANVAQAPGSVMTAEAAYSFQAQSCVDVNGVPARSIYVDSFDSCGCHHLFCSGSQDANLVSMNQGTGLVTVNGVVYPSDHQSCTSPNYSGGPLTLNVCGQPDGSYRNSHSGTGTETISGATSKYNFQSDEFGESLTGSSGLYTGTFSGTATMARSTKRTQVK
jgi:hypothetical protein